MKKLLVVCAFFALSGCSTIDQVKKYWPRDHDPVMFDKLVTLNIDTQNIDCEKPDWSQVTKVSEQLEKYTEWRKDPQPENIKGLHSHYVRMGKGGSKTFCELGKKTSLMRIDATKSAWEGR